MDLWALDFIQSKLCAQLQDKGRLATWGGECVEFLFQWFKTQRYDDRHEEDRTQKTIHWVANELFGSEGLPNSFGLHIQFNLVYTSAALY